MEQLSPEIPTPEQEPKILSFEEFSFCGTNNYPHYDNFFLHFAAPDFATDLYKKREYYKKFILEYPDIAEALNNKIQNMNRSLSSTAKSLEPFLKDLYEAYKIMRGYGVSDHELFA